MLGETSNYTELTEKHLWLKNTAYYLNYRAQNTLEYMNNQMTLTARLSKKDHYKKQKHQYPAVMAQLNWQMEDTVWNKE